MISFISEKRWSGIVAVAVSLLLIFSSVPIGESRPHEAYAEGLDDSINDAQRKVEDSQLTLDQAKAELDRLSDEYASIDAEIDEMQTEIDATAKQVMETQAKMLEGREALGNAARQEYKTSTASMYLDVILGSSSFDELTKGTQYIEQIVQHYSDEVAEQKKIKEELDQVASQLSKQKDEQDAKLAELDSKKDEAQQIVSRASEELEANSSELQSLQAQAEEMRRLEEEAQALADPTTAGSDASNASNGNSGGSPAGGASQPAGSTTGAEWRSGPASAYGGSSDPYTPNPGRTATGAVCDDYSMGVAVPMAWPNYRQYFGHTVEIVYNGRSVYATINDCGGMNGGQRHLDLQPGVFKAFGFPTCSAWGVRTVSYRIF